VPSQARVRRVAARRSVASLCADGPAAGDTRRVASFYRDPEAPPPNNPRRVGVVALIERESSLLLERRADFGTWGLPGEALDEDETVGEAVAREVREETGLETVSLDLFGVFSDPSRIIAYPDGDVFRLLTLAFVVEVALGEPQVSRESLELRFVPFTDVPDLELGRALVPVLGAYVSCRARPVVA
jgi:ADP-ribose pyrophosphatase YjhB (NUDIX family)